MRVVQPVVDRPLPYKWKSVALKVLCPLRMMAKSALASPLTSPSMTVCVVA